MIVGASQKGTHQGFPRGPHRSTSLARRRLTSQSRRDVVRSTWYGRSLFRTLWRASVTTRDETVISQVYLYYYYYYLLTVLYVTRNDLHDHRSSK